MRVLVLVDRILLRYETSEPAELMVHLVDQVVMIDVVHVELVVLHHA